MTNFKPFVNRATLEFKSREGMRVVYCGDKISLCSVLGQQINMYVPTDDVTMAPHLLLSGFWEPWITLYVQNTVKPGWKVVNVGAAFGYYTLLCAALGAEVVAFEPQEKLARLTQQSIDINGFAKQCKVVNAACGAERGRMPLYVDPIRVGGGTLQARGQQPGCQTQRVEVRTLDDYFDARTAGNKHKVDLMIIDVEGHEPEVLQGARQLLEFNHHAIIVLELSPEWYADTPGFLRELRERYTIYDIDGAGVLQPLDDAALAAQPQTTVALLPKR